MASTVLNVNRSKESDHVWSIKELLPPWHAEPSQPKSWQEIKAAIVAANAALGGKDNRKKQGA